MNQPTALVAHPFPIVVDALAALITAAGYGVTRASDTVAMTAALATSPDLAIVAAAFGGDAAAQGRNGATRTIVLADEAGGSDSALTLTAPAAELGAAIRAVTQELFPSSAVPALTTRERDVARLVTAGLRNRAIATSLGISEGTVKMHLHNVYTKLGLESRTQLAMAAASS